MSSSTKAGIALVGVVLTFTLTNRPAQAAPPDGWITTKARIALLTTDGAGRSAVKVDTEHGKITLHGKVHSQAVKDKAEDSVRGIDGVTSVRNLLEVVSEAREDVVKASDHDIKEAVEAAFEKNKNLEGIKVASVDNSTVLLNGHTKTLAQKLLAIETAYGCRGVQRVATEIETSDN